MINKSLVKYLSWRLYNPIIACAICSTPALSLICNHCFQELEIIPETRCNYCAKPVVESVTTCLDCLTNPPYFDKVYTKFSYTNPLNKIIQQFKYNQILNLAWPLGFLLHKSLELASSKIDYIVPTPLSHQRFKQRGFNQVKLMLEYHQSKINSFKVLTNIVKKEIDTPHMSLATKTSRNSFNNPFTVRKNLNGHNILIVDDVMTTGATANHLAYTLKDAGANLVEVCTLTRTINNYISLK